jgi:hypothetical protein
MSAHDVPRTIERALVALATELTQTKPNGVDLIMTNTNQNAMNPIQGASVQKTPLTFNVYDPSTGRTWNEDNAGRRIFARRDMTGTQLVRINSMRKQLQDGFSKLGVDVKIPYLNEHNVKSMSIDSASLMIDDYMALINGFNTIVMAHNAQYEVLAQQLDSALKDPKVGAELALKRQAENMKRESER